VIIKIVEIPGLKKQFFAEQNVPFRFVPKTVAPYMGAQVLHAERTTMRPPTGIETNYMLTDSRLVVTIAEAAKLLGISRSFGYELVKRGDLPVLRLGRRQLVPKAALSQLMESAAQKNLLNSKAVE
jgi:excisionase family DNA binding protein